jgi:SAM-dependent methyltransferase
MMEHASCAACGADDATLLFTTPDTRNPTAERFPVGRCRRCGHVYVVERPGPSDIGRYYPANYEEHRKTDAPRKKSRRHRRLRLRPGDRVLDIGCGSGYDLLRLKDRGCELFGIETDAEAASQARANGIAVFHGPAHRADFPDGHFHHVTMNHCLEHVHNPAAVLENVRRMIHPEGRIHLTFPTAEAVNFRVFGADWYHLDVPRHLHFFTHDSFRRLVAAGGLRIVHRTCSSGGRGLRRSLASVGTRVAPVGALARVVHTRPLEWVVKSAIILTDLLRQGEVAEYQLRRI